MNRLYLISAIALSLLGCKNDINTSTFQHGNGLILTLDIPHSQVQQTKEGFLIVLSKHDSRNPNEISIELKQNGPPLTAKPQKKVIDGEEYSSTTAVFEEGSGGREYVFTVWKSAQKEFILLNHHVQQEGEADFSADWKIIKNAVLATKGK